MHSVTLHIFIKNKAMAALSMPSTLTIKLASPFSPFGLSSLSTSRYHHSDLIVACNTPKFERRDLILGIGGLYGANSLAAAAAPLAPDYANCVLAQTDIANIPINCCPPSATGISDYVPSSPPVLLTRMAAQAVDCTYISKFEKAIGKMKNLSSSDPRNFMQQANVHCAYCNGAYYQQGYDNSKFLIHQSWLFFPWHRWFLYFFERMCQNMLDDDTFALPFWNWDDPEGMQIPAMFNDDESSPLYDTLRNQKHLPPTIINLDFNGTDDENISPDAQIEYNLCTMHRQMVTQSTTPMQFLGKPYVAGQPPNPGLGSIETVPHNTVHDWTGPEMSVFFSAARDPIFYGHHSNLDRLWTLWNSKLGCKNPENSDWLNSTFIFYNEDAKAVRVKVEDCLDTTKLGYAYQDVRILWRDGSMPKPRRKGMMEPLQGMRADEIFPRTLDKMVSVLVKRPKKSRSRREKDEAEEVLQIEGVESNSRELVKFDVYVNEVSPGESGPDKTEFLGSFVNVSHAHLMNSRTNATFVLTGVLEELGADDFEDILVTLVPKRGVATIKGINIVFDNSKVNV